MIDSIIEEYRAKKDKYEAFGEYLEIALEDLLKDNNIHSVTYRIKDEVSLLGKLELKQKYSSINDVTDILGVRILTYLPKEVDAIVSVLEDTFWVDRKNSVDKRVMEENEFGYMSYHLVLAIDHFADNDPQAESFKGLTFEVQIRTVLQHAWAEIEHDIGYKNPFEIPSYLKRRFFRLASLLELADDEFQNIVNKIDDYKTEMREKLQTNEEIIELNYVSLNQFIVSSYILERIKLTVKERVGIDNQKAFRFPENLLERLYYVGYDTINEINQELLRHEEDLIDFIVNYYGAAGMHSKSKLKKGVGNEIALFYLVYYKMLMTESDDMLEKFMKTFKLKSKYLIPDLKEAYGKV